MTQWPACGITTPWTFVAAALATTAIIGPKDFSPPIANTGGVLTAEIVNVVLALALA